MISVIRPPSRNNAGSNETPVPTGFRSQAVPDLSAYASQKALSLLPAYEAHPIGVTTSNAMRGLPRNLCTVRSSTTAEGCSIAPTYAPIWTLVT